MQSLRRPPKGQLCVEGDCEVLGCPFISLGFFWYLQASLSFFFLSGSLPGLDGPSTKEQGGSTGSCFLSRGSARGCLSVVGPSSACSAKGEASQPRKPAGTSSFCCWGSERGGVPPFPIFSSLEARRSRGLHPRLNF